MSHAIPEQIAHLDFTPEADSAEEFSLLNECGARRKGTTEQCVRPAAWLATFRCCRASFYCCNEHKKQGMKWGEWWCRKCKKTRNNDWMGWHKL